MARHEERTFGKVTLAKERLAGEVSLKKVLIASGAASVELTTAQAVETSACVADSRLKVVVNGVEYYLPLLAV